MRIRRVRLKELVQDGVDVFALQGEIDLHYSPVLRSILQTKIQSRCPALVLDFSGVSFIDSCGLSALLEYIRDASEYGGVLCLAAPSAAVAPILEVVRLDTVAPILPTLHEAIAAVKAGHVTSGLQHASAEHAA
jgi:stage II sporulation protein AA (anti-sigma F factor antagonist)